MITQNRELIKDTKYKVSSVISGKQVILRDESGKCELWIENNHFSGYVVEIGGKGYEFVRSY